MRGELSADALLPALARARPDEVLELLRGRDEAQRRAVAPAIRDALQRHRDWQYAVVTATGTVDWAITGADTPPAYYEALALAALGTLGLTDVRRTPLWPSDDGAFAVLAERRPTWLAGWAATASWRAGRMLTRAGLIPPLRDDTRIEALIAETRAWGDAPLTPATLLRDDPELLEHEVWRLFEVEGREVNLQSADARDEQGWNWALREAAANGRIDRARLLDASLEALTRDFGAHRNRWYTRLHTDLAPTVNERLRFADRYLDQLHSPYEETAAWAMDRVDELDRERPLDGAALLAGLTAVVTSTRKRTAKRALGVLRRLAEREPLRAEACARLAAEALVHEAPDVQALALALVPPSDALERFRDVIAPTNRAALEALIDAPDAGASAAAAAEPAPALGLEALAARIAAVVPVAREALELDTALAATRRGVRAPLPAPPLEEPRLDEPLTPIANAEELASALLELRPGVDRGDERYDLVLDAIARFCGSREALAGPLKPVLRRLSMGMWLEVVISAWQDGKPATSRAQNPLQARLRELMGRCAAGLAGPLLATPTHRGGWIDPRVLVERAAEQRLDPRSPDLLAALLRLAPEYREPALSAAAELPGPGGAVVRCALGGPDVAGSAPATIAARLTRSPPLLPVPRPSAGRWSFYSDELWPDPPAGDSEWLPWQWLNGRGRSLVSGDEPPAAFVWPGQRDLAHTQSLRRYIHIDTAALDVLLLVGEPVTTAAARLLATTLGTEIADERLLGVDAVIAAIETGRLDAPLLTGGLIAELPGSFVPARVARSLTSVAAVSVLHAETVREALDVMLGHVDSPKGMLPLLTLLNELSEDAGAAVSQRTFLESIIGDSKTAKAAKALLARTGTSRHAAAVAALALDARIARAERWSERV